jgi:uncharacterized protein YoxC
MKNKFLFILLSMMSLVSIQTITPMEQVKKTLPKTSKNNWLVPDSVISDEQIEYIFEHIEEIREDIKKIDLSPIGNHVNQVNETVKKVSSELKETAEKIATASNDIASIKISIDNSLINKDHADSAQKSFFISALGLLISGYGAKLLHDGICEISAKLDQTDYQDQWFWERLALRDYLKPTIGLIAITAGLIAIVQSKNIALQLS